MYSLLYLENPRCAIAFVFASASDIANAFCLSAFCLSAFVCFFLCTVGQNEKKTQNKYPSNQSLSHERGNEYSERASERVSAAEGASEASSPEQENE